MAFSAASSALKLSRCLRRTQGFSATRSISQTAPSLQQEPREEGGDSDFETIVNRHVGDTSNNNNDDAAKDFNFANAPSRKPFEETGIYRAILLGEVGQAPVQKRLRGGQLVTMFSVGTGGMRNNRKPLENESPREYADRSMVQWHRVAIYGGALGDVAMSSLKPGNHVYLEGNLEMKVYSDAVSGVTRRYREIALRREGRLIITNNATNSATRSQDEGNLRGVGYF